MASALVAFIWLISLSVGGVIKWRERGLTNLLSCLVIVLSFPLAIFVGHAIRAAVFSYNLERWNQAAKWVTAHHEPNQDAPIKLPEAYSDLASIAHYRNQEPCGLTVDFFWGSGFPVRHSVRRYATNPEWMQVAQCWRGWGSGRALTGDWYELSG
jgi:hypothetical protein